MTETLDFFVAGGTLRANDPSYVTRPADHDLLQQLQAGEFCYVLTPRQMGKSSLMVRTAQRLRIDGIRVAIIDLTSIGTNSSALSVAQWYLGLLSRVRAQLRLATDVQVWWDEHATLGVAQRFTTFLHDVLLSECSEPVVILIDEIDSTLNLNFRDDFFAAIRAIYNERATDPSYQQLTFALFGVATPTDLIQDRERTPFNIGRRIDLSEFSLADAQPLHDGLATSFPTQADAILERIFYWTNGHPYLTQKLCQILQAETLMDAEITITAHVDEAVQNTFLSEEGRKDSNLTFVQDRIVHSSNHEKRRMLQLYQRVQRNENVPDDDRSSVQNRLELYGLIGVAQGQLQIRNRIYQQVFDSAWIASMMPVDRRQQWAVLAGVGALLLTLGVIIFIFWQPPTECSVFSEQFIENQDSSVRLSALASLFDQGERCRSVALDLFYSLQPEEHQSLFLGLNDYPNERERLKTVIDGVYRTLDTVPDHDLRLMEIWLTVLQNAEVSPSESLISSIENWKKGREHYAQGEYSLAEELLSIAIMEDHYVLYYDHALSLIRQGNYTGALSDLNTLAELAIRVIPTPTPKVDIKVSPSLEKVVAVTSLFTETLVSALDTSTPTVLPVHTNGSQVSLLTYTARDYRRRFNSSNNIIALVEQTLESNPPLFDVWQDDILDYPNLQTLANSLVAESLSAGSRPGCINLIEGGNFEQFDLGWQVVASTRPPRYSNEQTFNNSLQSMHLGNDFDALNVESVSEVRYKPIWLPSDAKSIILRFLYYPLYETPPGIDLQQADLFDATTDQLIGSLLNSQDDVRTWKARDFDLTLYAGRSISLRFRVRNDGEAGRTLMFIDNVEIEYCAQAPLPMPSVTAKNTPPKFIGDPVLLAIMDKNYLYVMMAVDSDGSAEDLRFDLIEKPVWLQSEFLGNGYLKLYGYPSTSDVGDHKVKIKVHDAFGGTSETEFLITVLSDAAVIP